MNKQPSRTLCRASWRHSAAQGQRAATTQHSCSCSTHSGKCAPQRGQHRTRSLTLLPTKGSRNCIFVLHCSRNLLRGFLSSKSGVVLCLVGFQDKEEPTQANRSVATGCDTIAAEMRASLRSYSLATDNSSLGRRLCTSPVRQPAQARPQRHRCTAVLAMRAVIQRVRSASVEVEGCIVSSIGRGWLCLVRVPLLASQWPLSGRGVTSNEQGHCPAMPCPPIGWNHRWRRRRRRRVLVQEDIAHAWLGG